MREASHTLLRDGELVFEGNRIVHVGKGFEGRSISVIDAKGKLVAPGFIDTHVHSGHRASHRLITDTGRPMYFGQPFLEITVPKEGTVRQRRSALPQARRRGVGGRLRAQRRLHRGRAPAQRRDDLRRIRQPAARAGRAACGSGAPRQPRLSRRRATTAAAGSADEQGRLKRVATTRSAAGLRDRARVDREERRRRRRPRPRHPGAARGRDVRAVELLQAHARGSRRAASCRWRRMPPTASSSSTKWSAST